MDNSIYFADLFKDMNVKNLLEERMRETLAFDKKIIGVAILAMIRFIKIYITKLKLEFIPHNLYFSC